MSKNTKVKSDKHGLYVIAGGYVTRPFYGTIFKEGDDVKTHHFGGSTNAGVTFQKKELTFRKNSSDYEIWGTTGVFFENSEDDDNYNWYKNYSSMLSFFNERQNQEFKNIAINYV